MITWAGISVPLNNEMLFPELEWEFIPEPLIITKVDENERLPKGQKRITITRDIDYNLHGELEFWEDSDYGVSYFSNKIPAGTFIKYFEITGSNHSGSRHYTLENCSVSNVGMVIGESAPMKANLFLSELKIKSNPEQDIAHLSEWCLNGPFTPVFSRNTVRKISKSYSKERFEARDMKLESIMRTDAPTSYAMDHLLINTPYYKFVVAKVPEQLGPNWSSNIGIEYRTSWGKIPNSAEREEIIELLSFVFGRQLLPIGYTAYDKEENVVESYARDPWGYSAKPYCAKEDFPPVPIDIWHKDSAKNAIENLLPMYIQKCEVLNLKEALWNYWISRQMPLGVNCAILGASIEFIMRGWFNKKSKNNVYLEKNNFENLLSDEIKSIENKLKGMPNGEKIIGNIHRSNEAGIMKRYALFFKEIGIDVSDSDQAAIEERNVSVHAKALFEETDSQQLAIHARTFEVLFNKTVLKLLGYSGNFIGYTAKGWPERPLNQDSSN
jgi:hypothetical protein